MTDFHENAVRLGFLPSEMVAIHRALEPEEKTAAKGRQRTHGDTAPGRKADTAGKLPEVTGRTRDKVAAYLGISGRTLEKAAGA